MDMHALVRQIVEEVLQRAKAAGERPCVMVLAERDADVARRVSAMLGEERELLFYSEQNDGRTPERYLVPVLSCSDMADLAAGRGASPVLEEILRLLLSGLYVEVLEFAYRTHCETAPTALYSLYESYEKTLASYGLIEYRKPQPEAVRIREMLVTAESVSLAHKRGATSLLIPAQAKVTPLAEETAKNLNIRICKGL